MADSSVNPPDSTDEMSSATEFPVPIETLAIDGTRPQIGDNVDFKVSGTVTRMVNDVAYVKPSTVNDQPLPAPVIEPDDSMQSEGDRLRQLSQTVGNY